MVGGPLYRLAQRTGLVRDDHELARVAVVVALATWLPLLLLASAEGSLAAAMAPMLPLLLLKFRLDELLVGLARYLFGA